MSRRYRRPFGEPSPPPLTRPIPGGCDTCDGSGRIVAYGEEYTGEPIACGTVACPECTGGQR